MRIPIWYYVWLFAGCACLPEVSIPVLQVPHEGSISMSDIAYCKLMICSFENHIQQPLPVWDTVVWVCLYLSVHVSRGMLRSMFIFHACLPLQVQRFKIQTWRWQIMSKFKPPLQYLQNGETCLLHIMLSMRGESPTSMASELYWASSPSLSLLSFISSFSDSSSMMSESPAFRPQRLKVSTVNYAGTSNVHKYVLNPQKLYSTKRFNRQSTTYWQNAR